MLSYDINTITGLNYGENLESKKHADEEVK